MKKQLAILTGILAGVLLVASPHVVFADQDAIIGKVSTDKLVYDTSRDRVATVVYTVENQTNLLWTPYGAQPPTTYAYDVWESSSGSAAISGHLKPTIAQYLAGGQSDVFAIGTVDLTGLAPGNYRLWILDANFKALNSSLNKNLGAGAGFRIIHSGPSVEGQPVK